jgi:orotate phosphoribosyltransferase
MHSPRYLQCAQVLQYPDDAGRIAKALAEKMKGTKVDLVVGPALGGILVAYELARALGCRNIFAERVDDVFTFRRGFEIPNGAAVVIAEDVITTGGAAQEVLDLVNKSGGKVMAVAAIVNRSGRNPFAVPFHCLLDLEAPAWDPKDCPLCRDGKPVVKPGSRAEVKK